MKFLRSTKNKVIIISGIIILGLAGVLFTSFDDNRDFEISKHLDIYFTMFKNLNTLYVDKIDASKMIKTSIDEMLKTLDPYTVYIPESEIEDFKFMTTGQYGGIGASIRDYGKKIVITDVYENFPAQKAGLVPGDIIIGIEDINVEGKTTDQISELLKGQPGTAIALKIKKPISGVVSIVKITREEIKIESVPYYSIIENNIGFIMLTSFTENSGDEVKKALLALKEQGAKSIILDLRNNPGGLLVEAVNICNLFVNRGKEIVSTKGKYSKNDNTYLTPQPAVDSLIPLAIIVNSGSASASEIVSGALQDLDRAVIIGQRTYGKGLVQTTCDLSYNSKLKVTTAKYYIPSGRCIQALDYSHRNADGSVGKVPDSLITEFKTKKGRSVFDGGGILPDVKISEEEYGTILSALNEKNIMFDFVTKFCTEHKTIDPASKFEVSDALYNDFITFTKNRNFEFQTETEKEITKLENDAKDEKYLELLKPQIEELKRKINEEKRNDLLTYKNQISELLGSEIVSRYYYQKGSVQYYLRFGNEIRAAVSILKNSQKYEAILNGLEGVHLKK